MLAHVWHGFANDKHSLERLGAILILLRAEGDKVGLESDTWTTQPELNPKANTLVCIESMHMHTCKDAETVCCAVHIC